MSEQAKNIEYFIPRKSKKEALSDGKLIDIKHEQKKPPPPMAKEPFQHNPEHGFFARLLVSAVNAMPEPKKSLAPEIRLKAAVPVETKMPEAVKKVEPAKKEKQEKKLVPPFDIQDLPNAMRKEGCVIAPKFMERYFSGKENYAPDKDSEQKGINQNGLPFPKSMVDTDTVKMKWLLSFFLIKRQYDSLLDYNHLFKKAVIEILQGLDKKYDGPFKRYLLDNPFYSGRVDTWVLCKQDIEQLHAQFQFQLMRVSQYNVYLSDLDMLAALANFAFNAAIADFSVKCQQYNRYDKTGNKTKIVKYICTIHSIYVYAKDAYTFTDEKGKPSQYLGHWNKEGVIMSKAELAARLLFGNMVGDGWNGSVIIDNDKPANDLQAIYVKDQVNEKTVYYPFTNKDFVNWRVNYNAGKAENEKRGGEFLIYSDIVKIPLSKPFVVEMPEWTVKTKI